MPNAHPDPPEPGGALRRRLGRAIGARGSARRTVLGGALWNWGLFVVNAAILVFLTPFTVHMLGDTGYGFWSLLITLTGYLGLADFGVAPAIVFYVTKHLARGEEEQLNRYVSSAFAVFAMGGAIAILVGLVIAPFFGGWFGVPPDAAGNVVQALVLTVLTLGLSLPLNALSAVLVGKQRFDLLCAVDLVTSLLRTAGIVWTLKSGHGLVGLAAVNLVCSLLAGIGKAALARRVHPTLRLSKGLVGRREGRSLLAYGGFNLLATAAIHLTFQADAFVVGAAMGAVSVTYFAIGAKIPQQMGGMVGLVGRVLSPALGTMEFEGDRPRVIRATAKASGAIVRFLGPASVFLVILGPAFLERWMDGSAFRDLSGPVVWVMTVATLVHAAANPLFHLHQGTGRMRTLALFSVVEGITNLALSLALVGRFGLFGVALGTMIPAVIIRGLVMPYYACRLYGASLPAFLRGVWGLPLLAGAATAAAVLLTSTPGAAQSWVELLGQASLCTAIFWGIAFLGPDLVGRRAPD